MIGFNLKAILSDLDNFLIVLNDLKRSAVLLFWHYKEKLNF
jgi:sRNA-binding regulator protein Hfq